MLKTDKKLDKEEWMADKDSSNCMICKKMFGRLKNRRHHCRSCGRLVCGDCSTQRQELVVGEPPKRVCDGCFETLVAKEQVKSHTQGVIKKEYALIKSSSKISATLVRIFLLDGSFKTVYYDDNTSASDLVTRVCYSARLALFEVSYDIRDVTQFMLVPAEELVINIFARWKLNNNEFAKLVLPVYSIETALNIQNIPSTTVSRLSNFKMEVSPQVPAVPAVPTPAQPGALGMLIPPPDTRKTSGSVHSRSGSIAGTPVGGVSLGTVSSVPVPGGGSIGGASEDMELRILYGKLLEEFTKLRSDYEDLRKKHDILRSIQMSRSNKLHAARSEKLPEPGVIMKESRETSDGSTTAAPAKSGFFGKFLRRNPSSPKVEIPEDSSSEEESMNGSKHLPQGIQDILSPTNKPNSPTRPRNSMKFVGAPELKPKLLPSRKNSIQDSSGHDTSVLDDNFCLFSRQFDTSSLLKLNPATQSKLFYHTLYEIEDFVFAFDGLIKQVVAVKKGDTDSDLKSSNASTVSTILSEGDSQSLVQMDKNYIITVYEILSSMEGLYEFLFKLSEDWNKSINDWLFRSLRQYMTLPVLHPDVLTILLYCLARENRLFATETLQVVQQVIADSFGDEREPETQSNGAKPKNNLSRVLKSVNRMVETLNYVVGDLIPILPPEFNVIKMFTDRANIKIREDITTFYNNHRADIGNRDLLTLLSFADRQSHVLKRFGVDTTAVTDLYQDLLVQYCKNTETMMRQWMNRIAERDETAEVSLKTPGNNIAVGEEEGEVQEDMRNTVAGYRDTIIMYTTGQITHWPEDLMKCVGEQMTLVFRELEEEARDVVCTLMLNLVSEFVVKQRAYLDTLVKGMHSIPGCLERICAYINNHGRFVELLKEKDSSICQELEDHMVPKYDIQFQVLISTYRDAANSGIAGLARVISIDFREALIVTLFQPNGTWLDGPLVIRTLQATLTDYLKDIEVWLAAKEDVDKVLAGILRFIVYYYIEILLTSTHIRLSHIILQRLQEDVSVMEEVFREYMNVVYTEESLALELKPLKDIVMLCNMDCRDCGTSMVPFVKNELYRDFGGQCIKVWSIVMTMKGESKEVQDAVYANITHGGWNPAPVLPLMTISYLEAFKKEKDGKKDKDKKGGKERDLVL